MKIILFLLPVLALAKPAVELVPDADMPHLIWQWHRLGLQIPQPVRTTGKEPFADNQPNDVLLWETYTGQPISAGDLFIADYFKKDQPKTKNPVDLLNTVRECGSVTPTTITTIGGTTIPLTQVHGVVRRVIRVIP